MHPLEAVLNDGRYVLDEAPDGWAVFSKDRTRRYALGRTVPRLLPGQAMSAPSVAIVCGLNPSDAGASTNDMTVTKTIGFVRPLNCVSLCMVNLSSLIETDSRKLGEEGPEPHLFDVLAAFLHGMGRPLSTGIAAWGSHVLATPERIAQAVAAMPRPLMCFGTTRDGSPRHLSRLPYSAHFQPWRLPP